MAGDDLPLHRQRAMIAADLEAAMCEWAGLRLMTERNGLALFRMPLPKCCVISPYSATISLKTRER
jgi:hypothetical protein